MPYGYSTFSHGFPTILVRRQSHKGPQVYYPRCAFEIIIQPPCGFLIGSLRGFEICTGSEWAVRLILRMGVQNPYASARAHRAPYGTHMGHVRVVEIHGLRKVHIEQIESAYACDHIHRKRMISYGIPKGHRPVRLPKSYGSGITRRSHTTKDNVRPTGCSVPVGLGGVRRLVGCPFESILIQCCGNMPTGVIHVLCMLF